MVKRLERISPEPREAALRDATIRHFRKIIDAVGSTETACHFFKYRDRGVWRLVWGWGYQRKDLAPATPTICTNPQCKLLFVRHSKVGRDCPSCVAASATGTWRFAARLPIWATLIVVALLAGGFGYGLREWMRRDNPEGLPTEVGLRVTPGQWVGPSGGQIRYTVMYRSEDGQEEDVTTQVVTLADDPKVVELDEVAGTAFALSRGKTSVRFFYAGQEAQATWEVAAPRNPTRLVIEPNDVTLGVGTTARLSVWGEFEDGERIELSASVEWDSIGGGNVSGYRGQFEGVAPGKASLVARYRATPDYPYLTAEAAVTVMEEEYKSLELSVVPSSLIEGRAATLEAFVSTVAGRRYSVLSSSLLDLDVDPPQVAAVEGTILRGISRGAGKVAATFGKSDALSAECKFSVHTDPGPPLFKVSPSQLQLVLGEISQLNVASTSRGPVELVSSDPSIVEVMSGSQVAGRCPGSAEITIRQEGREEKVPVKVTVEKVDSIAFVPAKISVAVDGSVPLRLVGRYGDQREFDVVPDQITWEKVPTSTIAELDMRSFAICGRLPTNDASESLEARWNELRATAEVEVVLRPVRVELTPADSVALRVGEVATLQAFARYGDGQRVELSPSRLQWRLDPAGLDGLVLDPAAGTVRATKGQVGPARVVASYLGSDSNGVECRSLDGKISLTLHADRSVFLVDHAGQFRGLVADSTHGDHPLEGVRFESSNEQVLTVDPQTGTYRALTPGTVTVTAIHPQAESPATGDFRVFSPDEASLVLSPTEIRLVPDGRQPLSVELVAENARENISLVDGADSALVEFSQPGAVKWEPPELIGVSPGSLFEVVVRYGEMTARGTVQVLAAGDRPEIRVVPATASLAPGQPLIPVVEQRVPGTDDQWQEVTCV